jgi:hypothetical protein
MTEKSAHREKRILASLREKGWAEKDLKHVSHSLKNPKPGHVEISKSLNRFVYWTSLLVMFITNLLASFLLIPSMLFLSGFWLYAVVVIFGLTLGTVFSYLIRGIEHIRLKHHIFAFVFIPLLGVADIFVMSGVADRISASLRHTTHYSISVVIILYVFSFVIPYLALVLEGRLKLKERFKRHKASGYGTNEDNQ